MQELVDFERRLYSTVNGDAMKRIGRRAGMAGKNASLNAAKTKLGPDRAMSGFRRIVPLGVGFDQPSPTVVKLNFRPAGLWKIAERGRRTSGSIYPRRNNRKTRRPTPGRAVLTPLGYRRSSSYGPSKGTGVFRLASQNARRDVPQAARQALNGELRRAVRSGRQVSKVVVD